MVCLLGTLNLQPLISHGPRIVAQIILLVLFVAFFGLPAVERYLKKEVIIVETLKQTDKIPAPAITISVPGQIVNNSCYDINVSTEDCLEQTFLRKSKIINSVVIGDDLQEEVNLTRSRGIVREDFTFDWAGIYYTLALPLTIGTDLKSDAIIIGIFTNLNYLVFIHDPKYFLLNDNPTAIPGELRRLNTYEMKPETVFFRLELVEVNKLNLPNSPCNEDFSYNFFSCVKESVASKVV